jgi:hypothetical protein
MNPKCGRPLSPVKKMVLTGDYIPSLPFILMIFFYYLGCAMIEG